MTIEHPDVQTLPLDGIVPYWNNPRHITDNAIDQVADAIREYGYRQLIIVDPEHVIIAGHTRHAALRKLGYTEVPVQIADMEPERARAYRLVDNKTHELTGWQDDKLRDELRAVAAADVERFFPNTELWPDSGTGLVTDRDVADAENKLHQLTPEARRDLIPIVCPHCFTSTQVDLYGARPDTAWTPVPSLTGPEIPPEAAQVVRDAIARMDVPEDQPWRALEYLAADYLAGNDMLLRHTDPEHYARSGFCRGQCDYCDHLDELDAEP